MRKLGATLVAVSPETPDHSLSTAEKNSVTFEVLSDVGNRVAHQFGIVFQLPVDLRPIYEGFGINLSAANGDNMFELPIPAMYVIGTDRKICMAFVEPDYTKRLDPEEIIATLAQMTKEQSQGKT
jgi:peroxiredoxin